MNVERMPFQVTALQASVPEGVPIEWMGKELPSGPLLMVLRDGPGVEKSRGELDYARRHARAEFHVRVEMPELVDLLQTLDVDPGLTQPVYAVVRSEGSILDDHSFNLVGTCLVAQHRLLDGIEASLLPGH
jgi:hypothetical protein